MARLIAKRTVADQFISILWSAGVRRIYGVVGDSLNPVVDAVRRHEHMDWVPVRNEESGAFAAGAEAQLTGRLAACAGSSGPGNLHLINGLYDAHRSGAPVVALAAQIPSDEIGTGYFQETHPTLVFQECSHYVEQIVRPAQVARVTQIAIQHAIGQGGVSVVVLPGDLGAEPAEGAVLEHTYRLGQRPTARPGDEVLDELLELIDRSGKVTLFCGAGCAGAHDDVAALAGRLKAPVGHSLRGKEWIEYDNPYDVGMSGLLGYGACYEAMRECDLLLLLGTDFPYVQFMPTGVTIAQVDIRRERLGRRSRLDLGIWGDVRETVRALMARLPERSDATFLERMLARHRQLLGRGAAHARDTIDRVPIQPEYATSILDELASDDAIFTVDTGMNNVWAARILRATARRRFVGSFTHGSMANALPQAIGAQLAYPGRQVISLSGDGGFTMLMGDFLTLVQERLPVKVVVYDNTSLGMVKLEMLAAGYPDFGTSELPVDFAAIANAAGAVGVRVEDPGEVRDGLRAVLAADGPALLDLVTDPTALALPPKVRADQVRGYALAMTRLVLEGGVAEAYQMARAGLRSMPRS
jgi:pyruvate dehydrogenase (quinone)